MSEWNYTKCSKPFESVDQARAFMLEHGFAGQILLRDHGGYTAVCPTYPEGYYPDAVSVATISEYQLSAPATEAHLADPSDDACCVGPQSVTITTAPAN